MRNDLNHSVCPRRIIALPIVGLLFVLSACAPDSGIDGAQGPDPDRGNPAQIGVLDLPQLDPTLHMLAEATPQRGGATFQAIDVQPGELWVNVNCKGSGDLIVRFEPLDEFVFRCTDELLVTSSKIDMPSPRSLRLSVSVQGGVEWSLRVQQ